MEKWREYERLIAFLTQEEFSQDFTVIPNARIRGLISERKRQIDVLVDYRFNSDLKSRIIFDAKYRKRPIDIKEVESFEGLMRDVGAKRGYIICSSGHTKSALRRAEKHIGIRLVLPEEIEKIGLTVWDPCLDSNCTKGLILWDNTFALYEEDGPAFIQATSKCDECGKFQIWCWACGNRHCIENESEWKCSCKTPWFWLTSIENDIDENEIEYKSHYLLLISALGTITPIDRRPI